jgi:uncharacterized protein with LGFP repeats
LTAESSVLSRARACVVAVLIATVAVPVGSVLTATPAQAAPYGQLVIDEAARHLGQPYAWGATGPSSFDCSGFVGYIYRQFGVDLPRTSRDQYNAVQHVPQDQKQIGDLIFTYDRSGIYHVAIYAGGNMAWAATKTGDVVRPQALWTSSYYVGRPALGGAIMAKWQAMGGDGSVLGQPLNVEHAVPGARKTDFQNGDIYWSPGTGVNEVHGAIASLYDRVGGSASFLGIPRSDENGVAGARLNRFTGGAVYWTPQYGVHEVHGGIAAKYDVLGGAPSALGVPTSDEGESLGGRVNRFAGGAIYWGPQGGFEVHGGIAAKYDVLGGASGVLGRPLSDEHAVPGGVANRFVGGSIYWGPQGGFEVHGALAGTYDAMGGPAGSLGMPTSDERAVPGGRESSFQRGVLHFDQATGAVTVRR